MLFVILIYIEGHKFTSFCNYSVLPSLNKVYCYYYYYYYYYYYPKSQWKRELSAILEDATAISNDTIFLGDFSCDMIEPNKPPMDGRDLCGLLDIYNLKNLITSPTRTTEKTTTISISFLQTTRKEYYHRAWLMSKSLISPSSTEF